MALPSTDTLVLYPAGGIRNTARVLHVETLPDGRSAVLLDATACHPVDAGWPDQPADRAVLTTDAGEIVIEDAVVAATDGAALHLGADIPARKGDEGWAFVVAHLVAAGSGIAEGDTVTVVVDADYRRALSVGHTACHLASLALNRALSARWTKEVRADGLEQPDFDGAAIELSLIREHGSTDVYRLNKSLRRKGFTVDGLAEELAAAQQSVNATLAGWTATGAAVRIDRDGDRLTDRRYWVCELPDGTVSIPCGGTHVGSLAELGTVTVALLLADVDGTPTLTMQTEASV